MAGTVGAQSQAFNAALVNRQFKTAFIIGDATGMIFISGQHRDGLITPGNIADLDGAENYASGGIFRFCFNNGLLGLAGIDR